jgi:OOP family OmpA-OmpF porin
MNPMRRFILSLTAFSLSVAVKAQFSFAMVGGPQSNAVTPAFTLLPDTVTHSLTKHVGLNFGFIGNASLNKKQSLFFRTGVLYSAKGAQAYQKFDTSNTDLTKGNHFLEAVTNLKVNYIDVPANLLFKLPIKGKTKFLLGGGVQASLFYSGSTTFSRIRVYKVHQDSAAKTEFKEIVNEDLPVGNVPNKYSVLHFSANALTGFEFGRVFITVNYSNGLTDFYKTEDQSFKHKTLAFNFGLFLENPQAKTPTVKDRDGDGITDDIDGCPDMLGMILTNGCPDTDGDGIADREDNCPNQAGTLQNHGCPVLDSDHDSVNDEEDKCPDQAGTIENHGCPVLDKDSDGVPDEEDKCPEVAGLPKYNGCPVPDTDNDGVNDEEDKCPEVAGNKDNYGCPEVTKEEQQKVTYAATQIQFKYNQAVLSSSSHKQLNEVVDILKKNPTLNLKIEGHTSGPDSESNRILSQKRAESVKEYFVSKGIAAERMEARGFGSSKPISKKTNQQENSEDRRVELIIF